MVATLYLFNVWPILLILNFSQINVIRARHLLILTIFSLFSQPSLQVIPFKPSPCPDTFTYEQTEDDTDRWFGDFNLKINQTADGVSFRITLDKPAQLLVVSLPQVNSTHKFKISSYCLE